MDLRMVRAFRNVQSDSTLELRKVRVYLNGMEIYLN